MDCRSNFKRCNANCCRYLSYVLENDNEDMLRYIRMHEGVVLIEWMGKHIVCVPCKCKHLKKDGSCDIYDNRPDVCKGAYQKNKSSHIFFPNCIYTPALISPVIKNHDKVCQ